MQQRFMSSYAGDPEAHTPLLYDDITPPLPPKTQVSSHQRDPSGAADEWGYKLRVSPSRVPVPPMPTPTPPPEVREVSTSRNDPEAAMPTPEPSAFYKLFPTATLLQFPRVQFSRTNTRMGRLPSLHIQFLRESERVVSSPTSGLPEPDKRVSLPQSTISAPSTLSRPFATMSSSPLPPLEPISPISISRSSPTSQSKTSPERSDSIGSVGHHLFARKASAEDVSSLAFSRNPSQQSRPSPGTGALTLARGNGSASSASSTAGGLRRATTWTPNVLASYSPWKGVVQGNGWADGLQAPDAGPSRVESPGGQIRVAEAYRPMPTLTETVENVAAASFQRPLSEPGPSMYARPDT
ncbi:hypothetical protein OH77DRAFT_1523680 [Trametes cingulata]|nr:hypothetical protein OH77DRAFT_1523680 [Trametes cingulata]